MEIAESKAAWPDAIYAHFKRVGIRQVGYVPDAGHSRLIRRCIEDPEITDVVLTTEEEGIALSPAPSWPANAPPCSCSPAASATASTCSR